MFTILAWMVFIPAIVWNLIFFAVAFVNIIESRELKWANTGNLRDTFLSLVVLFIPGVYLFGWF